MELPVLRLQPGDVAVNGGALKHHPPDIFELRLQAEPREFLSMPEPLVLPDIGLNFGKIRICLKFGFQLTSVDPDGKVVQPVVLIGGLDDHVVDEQGVFQLLRGHSAVLVKQLPVEHGQRLLVKVAQLPLIQQVFQMPRVPAQPFNPDVHEGGQIVVHSGFIRAAPDGKEEKHGKTEGKVIVHKENQLLVAVTMPGSFLFNPLNFWIR